MDLPSVLLLTSGSRHESRGITLAAFERLDREHVEPGDKIQGLKIGELSTVDLPIVTSPKILAERLKSRRLAGHTAD